MLAREEKEEEEEEGVKQYEEDEEEQKVEGKKNIMGINCKRNHMRRNDFVYVFLSVEGACVCSMCWLFLEQTAALKATAAPCHRRHRRHSGSERGQLMCRRRGFTPSIKLAEYQQGVTHSVLSIYIFFF